MQLLETIKIKNKQKQNITWHNQRFNISRLELFGVKEPLALENIIQIPASIDDTVYKCRIVYSKEIKAIEFEKYTPKIIKSLKIIECNDIDYSYKYHDRTKLNNLFQHKSSCDDILIVKNGFVTDTSYANIVFWDGKKWITPATPLLKGTVRERLLSEGKIFESEISKNDLPKFEKSRIINAMNDLGESQDILIFEY